jgi:hypothetical protein
LRPARASIVIISSGGAFLKVFIHVNLPP